MTANVAAAAAAAVCDDGDDDVNGAAAGHDAEVVHAVDAAAAAVPCRT